MSLKNIAVVAGGYSSEYIISIKSAIQIEKAIDKQKYKTYTIIIDSKNWYYENNGNKIDVNKNDFSITINDEKIKFDCAFIIIHGTPGEDGILQAYFNLVNIPFTTCGVLTSALTFNKDSCKRYLNDFSVQSAKAVLISKGDVIDVDKILSVTNLPCFVKPNNGGSSFGVTKVKDKTQMQKAIQEALSEDNEVIIEEFLDGIEVTCGVLLMNNEIIALPLTEIVSRNDFFDFEAKYTDGMADEITPARISKEQTVMCHKLSKEIYQHLNCKGIVRIDYILKDNMFFLIEVNTIPGMSPNSIVPQQIRNAGISVKKVVSALIENAMNE